MTEIIERVARAIAEVAGMSLDSLDMEVVRAAIAAMPGEPVAWRWRFVGENDDHWTVRRTKPPEFVEPQMRVEIQPLYAAPAMPATDAVREAAQAVIDRWETPTWKDAPATAVYINALKAALSHPSQGGWQPIETAPKDGTRIDLLYPYPRGRTVDCFWRQDEFTGLNGCWGWISPTWDAELLPEKDWSWNSYPNMQPTHWREAPTPPEVQP